MTPMTTHTTDTIAELGAAAGRARTHYWDAVDRADRLAMRPSSSVESIEAASAEAFEALTECHRLESALQVCLAGLNLGTQSAPGVVFVPVEVYAARCTRAVPVSG